MHLLKRPGSPISEHTLRHCDGLGWFGMERNLNPTELPNTCSPLVLDSVSDYYPEFQGFQHVGLPTGKAEVSSFQRGRSAESARQEMRR